MGGQAKAWVGLAIANQPLLQVNLSFKSSKVISFKVTSLLKYQGQVIKLKMERSKMFFGERGECNPLSYLKHLKKQIGTL
jgi:hypothetical protein